VPGGDTTGMLRLTANRLRKHVKAAVYILFAAQKRIAIAILFTGPHSFEIGTSLAVLRARRYSPSVISRRARAVYMA
jgi:hypothetical protein